MTVLYVLGGGEREQARRQQEWHRFRRGLVLTVETDTGRVTPVHEYVSPPEACPDWRPSILFKAGALAGDRLYACTQTEVMVCDTGDFTRRAYVSLPCFNDVHHVTPTPRGTLLVVSTGLDLVVEIREDGSVVREWSVVDPPTWERFSRTVDYRKVATTKPHLSHPNHVFTLGDDVWVTRLVQRDCLCLTDPGRRIDIAVQQPHDGVVFEGSVYFTTVDGHVVVADAATGRVTRVVDLRAVFRADRPLGWCRGIKVLDHDRVLIGFTRLRPTRVMESVSWVKEQANTWLGLGVEPLAMPTRICGVDLARGRPFWEVDIEAHGMHAVFSIL
ncbi:MAG TPA: hypothetical protein VD995_31405 [Azospirillum sp.]|nr:hypothetical protein [Azospirillum sp.]